MKPFGLKEMVKLQEQIDNIKDKITDKEYNDMCIVMLELYKKKKEFILFKF